MMNDNSTIGLWVSVATAVSVACYPILNSAVVRSQARRVSIGTIEEGRQGYKTTLAAKSIGLFSCIFAILPLVVAYVAPRLGTAGVALCCVFSLLMFVSGFNHLRMLARSTIVLDGGRLTYRRGKHEEVCDIYDMKSVYVSGGYVVIERSDTSKMEFPVYFRRMPLLLAQLQFACRTKGPWKGKALEN